MVDIKKIENELYGSIYGNKNIEKYKRIWNEIKNNKEVLEEAIKVIKDKFDEKDVLVGLTIADSILTDYKSIDENIYSNLIAIIYNNIDIARMVIDGASNGGYSFLLMSLFNKSLKLTQEQKDYAVNEAMYKVGTTRFKKLSDEAREELIKNGCPETETGIPMWLWYINYKMNPHQAHGTGEYDIRYHILNNDNWTKEEKEKLVYEFWYEDKTYDEYLEQWEWGIINDSSNFKDENFSQLDKADIFYYSYNDLLNFYNHDKEITDRIFREINFLRQMHELRPQQWELEFVKRPKKLERSI